MRPGTYELEGVRVTFWDPALLVERAPARRALRGLDLVQDGAGDDGGKGARTHAEARARSTSQAAVGARDIVPTEAAGRLPLAAAASDADVDVIETPLDAVHDAARGRRAAALTARLLAQLPASDAQVAAEVADVRAEPAERALALAMLRAVAGVPVVAEALAGQTILRDVGVALAIGARTLTEGRLPLVAVPATGDLLAIDVTLARGEGVEVVRAGLSLRATALARAMDRTVRGILVVV